MKNILKIASAVAVAFALTQTIQAVPITGNIGFTGSVTYDTSSAGTATQVTAFVAPVIVFGTIGSFTSIPNFTPAVFTASVWNFNTAVAINNFWSVGGFTFQLLSSTIASQGGVPGSTGFVVVNGVGIVSGNGYEPTVMSWSFTSQDPKSGLNPDSWTFSASANSSNVPDGASTMMLLGLGLSGAALLRRKLTA